MSWRLVEDLVLRSYRSLALKRMLTALDDDLHTGGL